MKIDEFKDALKPLAYTITDTKSGIISIYTHNYWGGDNHNEWCFQLAHDHPAVIVNKQYDKLDGMPLFCLRDLLNLIAELEKTPVNERFPESKYTVQVLADYDESFLNVGKDDGFAFFKDEVEAGPVQTQFTQAEIDELKQRPDLAIDWDKAIIKEVKNDED